MFVDGLKSQTGLRSLTFILIRISFFWCLESQDLSFNLRQVVIAIEFGKWVADGSGSNMAQQSPIQDYAK